MEQKSWLETLSKFLDFTFLILLNLAAIMVGFLGVVLAENGHLVYGFVLCLVMTALLFLSSWIKKNVFKL